MARSGACQCSITLKCAKSLKVIVSKDAGIRDAIIRATNNQTDVELASLHATDKIQRDIEDVLLRHGLYYERRKNFYANQGHTPAELVTPLYAAAGFVALVMKAPQKASLLRSKFMRSQDSYEAVFSAGAPLEVWPKIVLILKRVDAELEALRPQAKMNDKFLKGWRYVTALLLVSESLRKFTFSEQELASVDPGIVTAESVGVIWAALSGRTTASAPMGGWTSLRNVIAAYDEFAESRGIKGIQALVAKPMPETNSRYKRISKPPTDAFVELVRAALPPQPWKPGVHVKVSKTLNCETPDYFAAVDRLIEEGVFLTQRDGVLYDKEGNVVAFDTERVDPNTLELIGNKT